MDQDGQTRRGAIGALMSSLAAPHMTPTSLGRVNAVEFVSSDNIFVADDLATATAAGELAIREGEHFRAVSPKEGIAEVRIRTAAGSDLLYEETTKAALQSAEPRKGADMVSLPLPFADAVPTTVAARIRATAFNAGEVGMNAEASPSVNTSAYQKAIDYAREKGIALELPGGEIQLNSDITVAALPTEQLFTMTGQGSGKNGTFLHFTKGSFIVHSAHQLSSFQITSRGGLSGPHPRSRKHTPLARREVDNGCARQRSRRVLLESGRTCCGNHPREEGKQLCRVYRRAEHGIASNLGRLQR